MLGPGGAVAGFGVGLDLLSGCLHTQQRPHQTGRLAGHAGGLGAAFQHPEQRNVGFWVNARLAKWQQQGGSGLRISKGSSSFTLASYVTNQGGNPLLLLRDAVHTVDAC